MACESVPSNVGRTDQLPMLWVGVMAEIQQAGVRGALPQVRADLLCKTNPASSISDLLRQ